MKTGPEVILHLVLATSLLGLSFDMSEKTFSASESQSMRVSGSDLEFFVVAYEEFKKDQNLRNFDVKISRKTYEKNDVVEIVFIPHLDVNNPMLGGRNVNGKAVTYLISVTDFIIIKKHYSR